VEEGDDDKDESKLLNRAVTVVKKVAISVRVSYMTVAAAQDEADVDELVRAAPLLLSFPPLLSFRIGVVVVGGVSLFVAVAMHEHTDDMTAG
jgi:hypothetical protein